MFNLFKKSNAGVKIIDKIWMYEKDKWNACEQMNALYPNCLFIAWFEETYKKVLDRLNLKEPQSQVVLAHLLEATDRTGRILVFVEHFPLAETENALFMKLELKEANITSSLDEPLFKVFNGDGIIEMLKKMGVKEDEVIGHSMVTKSIQRAQLKLKEGVHQEKSAPSQEQWFKLNITIKG